MDRHRPFVVACAGGGNVREAYRAAIDDFLASLENGPAEFDARGGVAIVGGSEYFPAAHMTLRLLRKAGCTLPVEILGPPAVWKNWERRAVEEQGGTIVDMGAVMRRHPVRMQGGWPIRAYALLFACSFDRVICLDAGVLPTEDLSAIMRDPSLDRYGMIFWPKSAQNSTKRTAASDEVFRLIGLLAPPRRAISPALMVLDRAKAWRCLRLADWMSQRLDVVPISGGSAGCIQVAAHTTGTDYIIAPRDAERRADVTTHFDLSGDRVLCYQVKPEVLALPKERTEKPPRNFASKAVPRECSKILDRAMELLADLQAFRQQHLLRVHALTVCVNYGDYLAQTLPLNRAHFDSYTVVTTDEDRETQDLCRELGVNVILTIRLHLNGSRFDKGAAINDGLDILSRDYGGDWFCLVDADIILPRNLRGALDEYPLEPTSIYGIDRGLKSDQPISGFFQLFHSSQDRRYKEGHHNAGYTDTWFRDLWPADRQVTIPNLRAHHLCKHGVNWSGRVSPRYAAPATESKPATGRQNAQDVLSFFDQIYVLNLDRDADRMKRISARLARLNMLYRRFAARLPQDEKLFLDKPALKPGHLACARSHRAVMEEAMKCDRRRILILEDDAVFRDDLARWMAHLIPQLNTISWDVFYLGLHLAEDGGSLTPNLGRVIRGFHTHAYSVTARAMPRLIESIDQSLIEGFHFDRYPRTDLLKVYAQPILAIQEPSFSSVQDRHVDRLGQYFPRFNKQDFLAHCAEAREWERQSAKPLG